MFGFRDRIVISKVCFFSIVRPRSFWLEGDLLERKTVSYREPSVSLDEIEFLWHLFVGCDPLGLSQISVEGQKKIENLLPRLKNSYNTRLKQNRRS